LPGNDSRALPAICLSPWQPERRHSKFRSLALRSDEIYGVLPADHRLPYNIEDVLHRILDRDDFTEFQPDYAPEMLCANCAPFRTSGSRNRQPARFFEASRFGGIIYTETARKVAYFVELAERQGTPILYVQDVSGFMVGQEAESAGIIRAGAEMVETMSCATVPRIVLTINHASGAGYYAMAGQGFDPNFTFSWPTARIGVMEGDSAVQALVRGRTRKSKAAGRGNPRGSCRNPSPEPAPITNGGSTRNMPPPAATAMPSSIPKKRAKCSRWPLNSPCNALAERLCRWRIVMQRKALMIETIAGRVARICINRPEKRNALNLETCRQLLGGVRSRGIRSLDWRGGDLRQWPGLLRGHGSAGSSFGGSGSAGRPARAAVHSHSARAQTDRRRRSRGRSGRRNGSRLPMPTSLWRRNKRVSD
jgi:hypothetical protein